jgi:DNA-binding MarR family transcriptional regulator
VNKADFEALSAFRYRLRQFLRFSEEAVRKERVTPLQYLLLLHIKGYPGREWATVGELAERLQSHHHGVVALVSRCEKLGLVKRVTSAVDARQVEAHLTLKGERCLTRLAQVHRDELDRMQALPFAANDPPTSPAGRRPSAAKPACTARKR